VEDYFCQLESHFPIQNPPTTTTFRNAWNKHLPVDDIAYSVTPTEFPNLPPSDKTHKSTATTAQETGSTEQGPATAVSAITESIVSHTIKSGLTEFENRRKLADDAFALRMRTLEKQVGNINKQVDDMATKLQLAIIKNLISEDGIISKLITNQDQKIIETTVMVAQLAKSMDILLA
jgi:hypothetical protein